MSRRNSRGRFMNFGKVNIVAWSLEAEDILAMCWQTGLWLLIFGSVSRVLSEWFRCLVSDNVELYVKVVGSRPNTEIRGTF